MKIKTLFFGIASDLVNASELLINVDKNATVADFKLILKKQFVALDKINSYAIAVNEEYAVDDLFLKETDIIAIIPPVSGG